MEAHLRDCDCPPWLDHTDECKRKTEEHRARERARSLSVEEKEEITTESAESDEKEVVYMLSGASEDPLVDDHGTTATPENY